MTSEEAKANLEKLLLLYDDGMIDFHVIRESVKIAIETLQNSPAQMPGTSDLISRQLAIHTITSYDGVVDKSVAKRLLIQLPPTQPEPCGDVVSRNAIVQKLNKMDRYVSTELRLCDTDKKFPQNEVFIVDDVYEEIVEQLPPTQPERLTDDDFETIRIHLSAYKERLCNQHRWEEAEEYQRIIDRFMRFASEQPEIIHCRECKWSEKKCDFDNEEFYYWCRNWEGVTDADGFCHEAERRTD